MNAKDLNKIYKASEEVVAREIAGEFILVPLSGGIAEMNEDIFTLNETGKAIWDKLDGKKTLQEISEELNSEFSSSSEELTEDLLGFTAALLGKKMLLEIKDNG